MADIPDEWLEVGRDTWNEGTGPTEQADVDAVTRAVANRVRADTAAQLDARADEVWSRNIRRAKEWRLAAQFIRDGSS
jgi:hypothetical protein